MFLSELQNIFQSECSSCHFLAFYNPFMMLFHILRYVLDHELILDSFLIPSSVEGNVFCVGKKKQNSNCTSGGALCPQICFVNISNPVGGPLSGRTGVEKKQRIS